MATETYTLSNSSNTLCFVNGTVGAAMKRIYSLAHVNESLFNITSSPTGNWILGNKLVNLAAFQSSTQALVAGSTFASGANASGTADVVDFIQFTLACSTPSYAGGIVSITGATETGGTAGGAVSHQWYYHTAANDYTVGTLISGQTGVDLSWTASAPFLAAIATTGIGFFSRKTTDTVATIDALGMAYSPGGEVIGSKTASGVYIPFVPTPPTIQSQATLTMTASGINFPAGGVRVFRVGTSITANCLANGQTYMDAIAPGVFTVTNLGASGSQIPNWYKGAAAYAGTARYADLATKIDTALLAGEDVWVSIELATNDNAQTPATVQGYMNTFLGSLRTDYPAVKFIINGPIYRPQNNGVTHSVQLIHAMEETLATTRNTANPTIDYVGWFDGQKWGAANYSFYVADATRIHPDTAGSLELTRGQIEKWLAAMAVAYAPTVIPDNVTGLTAELVAGVMTLEWDEADGATSYVIYRKVGSAAPTLVDGNYTGGLTFADTGYTGALPKYYTVAAKNSIGTSTAATARVGSGGGGSNSIGIGI